MNSTAALPYHIGSAEADAVRVRDLSGETLLDIVAQCCVRGQLARLWPPSRPIGVPLRGARSIIEAPAPRGGIALQLARDRAWRPSKLTGDGSDPRALGHFDCNSQDRKSTRLNSSHSCASRMPSSA